MQTLNKFTVIVTVYNSEKDIGRCIESILTQDYPVGLMVIDDCSTDGTWAEIRKYNIDAIKNGVHTGSGIANRVTATKYLTLNDNDIIVSVDGDDYLVDNKVFSYLNRVYTEDVWLTYGQYTSLSGRFENICQPLNEIHTVDTVGRKIVISVTTNEYRKCGVWCTSHLKTFRKFLWDNIKDEDFRYSDGAVFKDLL